MKAYATVEDGRISLATQSTQRDFSDTLRRCKLVNGGRYLNKRWLYPLAIDTCLELRSAFGEALTIDKSLGDWYREAIQSHQAMAALAAQSDARLSERVPVASTNWLRGKQRAGARWIALGYRGGGIVADKPGVGKTGETLVALVEADLAGPVLIVCPKASVRMVWGLALKRLLPHVPAYLCHGTRAQRERTLAAFSAAVQAEPSRLVVCVVVAEMLRVKEAPRCYDIETGKEVRRCDGWQSPVDVGGERYCSERHVLHHKNKKIVGYDYPELFNATALGGGWEGFVVDESHRVFGSLTVVKGNLKGKGLQQLPARAARPENGWRRAVTGTPFGKGGRVQGMFGTLHWLWPDEYTSFWRWAEMHLDVEEKVINRAGKTVKKINGLRGLSDWASDQEIIEANERFLMTLGPRILRRTKEEVWPELPPKAVFEVVCEMAYKQSRQYAELAQYGEFKTRTGSIAANGVLSLRTRERQLANGSVVRGEGTGVHFEGDSGKLDQFYQMLDDRGILDGDPGFKIVAASEFTEFLDRLANDLTAKDVAFFRIDGSVTDRARDDIVKRWQATQVGNGTVGNPRVLLIQSKTAGISIDLDAADEMHMLDEMDNPEDNEQVEDRIHRANNLEHDARIYYYRTEGTIDHRKAHDVELKRRAQHAVLDGRRGVEDLRRIMMERTEELV